jgi:aminoglycoside phosphotransferase (APT) family kinase protein
MVRPMSERLHAGDVPRNVADEVTSLLGSRIVDASRLSGGASRSGWRMRLDTDGSERNVYVRVGSSSTASVACAYNVTREAQIVSDVVAAGVPAPRVLAISNTLPLAVMEFISGTSDFDRIRALKSRRGVGRQYLNALHALHQLDVRQVGSLTADDARTIGEATASDLGTWRELASQDGIDTDPLVRLTDQWLDRNMTTSKEPPRVVHGDAGPGNFMFRNGRITALVDWELAHVGDPAEDLGWILLRAGDAPLTEVRTWIRGFEQVSQRRLEVGDIRFQRIVAMHKTIVALSSSLAHDHQGRMSQLVSLLALYRYQQCRLLLEALGVVAADIPVAPEPTVAAHPVVDLAVEGTELLEQALESGGMDATSRAAVRRARLIFGFFARREEMWRDASASVRRDAGELLGAVPDSVEDMLRDLLPHADLTAASQAVQVLQLLLALEQRRLALWPGLSRRAEASFRSTNDLTYGGSA